jgi:glucan phosphoethanolaminetransferase (alkaline phosphatase superfamily)
MAVGVTILLIVVLIIAILVLVRLKKFKHELVAIFLIALLLFGFFSFNAVFKGKDISVKNLSDVGNLGKMYFSWLGNIFNNVKVITTQAVKMDWNNSKST